jgi:hypothetical protein
MPPLQTLSIPQDVPFGALPDSRQTGAPVLQAVVPVRQAFPATVHVAPAVHATHMPVPLQTLSWPHAVPAGTVVPVSVHVGVPPVHDNLPE